MISVFIVNIYMKIAGYGVQPPDVSKISSLHKRCSAIYISICSQYLHQNHLWITLYLFFVSHIYILYCGLVILLYVRADRLETVTVHV